MKIYVILLTALLSACSVNSISPSTLKQVGAVEMNKNNITFDDGDTISYENITIRILGIDTPEIMHEEHGIFKDQEFGREAAEFTKNRLLKAKTVYYVPCKKDVYGRMLAHVVIDGELLAAQLIKAGLAYETISYYGSNGFLEFEQKILEAWEKVKKPNFENPILWRRKYQNDFE